MEIFSQYVVWQNGKFQENLSNFSAGTIAQTFEAGVAINTITLNPNARANMIFYHDADAISNNAQILTQINLASGATLNILEIQALPNTEAQCHRMEVRQGANSQFTWQPFTWGSAEAKRECHIMLEGEGANCDLRGLFIATQNKFLDQQLFIDHIAPHTQSHIQFRGIATDSAHATYRGCVNVAEKAFNAIAVQGSTNLLLSNQAEINAKPELNIETDAVQCRHGATVGQLDPEALFYLQARGLEKVVAEKLLLQAFMQVIFDAIPDEKIRGWVQNQCPI